MAAVVSLVDSRLDRRLLPVGPRGCGKEAFATSSARHLPLTGPIQPLLRRQPPPATPAGVIVTSWSDRASRSGL